MKILYLTLEDMSFHKGSVIHIKEVISGFRKKGHSVDLIACSTEKFESTNKTYNLKIINNSILKFFRLKKQPYIISSVLLFLNLLKILSHYHIIYARDYHTVLIALLPRIIFKKKLVFEMNGIANEEQKLRSYTPFNKLMVLFIYLAERLATRYADKIITVTSQIANYLIENFHCYPEKIKVVNNGVNTERFFPMNNQKILKMREDLGINVNDVVITFIGNLAPWQGVEYVIKVAPLIIKEIKYIKFLIVGDGVLKNNFQSITKNMLLSEYFIFTGMVDHNLIPIYINISDICILPKIKLKSGYSPIKLYEYIACGKPVLASRVGGLEFIEFEGIGILVNPEDINEFKKALDYLIRNPQERIKMGQKALGIVRERYNWETQVSKIEKILNETV